MDYFKIRKYPITVFFSTLKHLRIMQIRSSEEGEEMYQRSLALYETEPEWDKLRNTEGYKRVG